MQVLTKERSGGISSGKGSLCLYGSTEFVAQVQAHWQKEGYCDYTVPPQAATLSGTHVRPLGSCVISAIASAF